MPGEFPHSDTEDEILDVDELAAGLGLSAPSNAHGFTGGGHSTNYNQSNYRPGTNNRDQQDTLSRPRLTQDHQASSSPADGYSGRSDSGRSGYANAYYSAGRNDTSAHNIHNRPSASPISSQVPHVPDRWVSDPSLEHDKAREAREGRQNRRPFAADRQLNRNLTSTSSPSSAAFSLLNPHPQSQPDPPPQHNTHDIHQDNNKYNNTHDFYSRAGPSSAATQAAPTGVVAGPSSASTPQHQQFTPRYPSSSTPSPFHGSGPSSAGAAALPPPHLVNRPRRNSAAYSERSSLFSEAPPAYTPSPTSPTSAAPTTFNRYQTFSNPSAAPSSTSPSTTSPPSNMGRPSESEGQGLLVGQAYQAIPESMGGDPDQHDENEFTYPRPTWQERLKRFSIRRHWKTALLGVILTFVTIGFLVTSIKGIKGEKTIKTPDEANPVTRPSLPQTDADGNRLAYPPYDKEMAWDQRGMCGDKMVTYSPQTFDLVFDASRNISLFQDIKEQSGAPTDGKGVKVSGEVVVRRAAPGTPGPAIVVETVTNDEGLVLGLDWDDKEQQLYIMTPLMISPWMAPSISPCVQVRATMWVPADSVIDSLNVEGVHLGVKLLDNLSLKLNSFARLASTVGSVVAATDGEKDTRTLMIEAPPSIFVLDTRYVEVKTMSSVIAGSWPLCDYLGLETISGSIQAGVRPKPALPDKPRPAILYARSTSGPIELHEPVNEAVAMFGATQSPQGDGMSSTLSAETFVPPRQYGVDLYSMSGTVTGSLAFGYSAKVHTTSGRVTLTLLPVLDQAQASAPDKGSMIETSTTSGTTAITVMDALWRDAVAGTFVPAPVLANTTTTGADASLPAPPPATLPNTRDLDVRQQEQPPQQQQPSSQNPALRVLSARHSATSANLYLTYPRSWEGYIDCDSLSGKIEVGGQGVQIIKRENGLPGIKQHVLAGKGDWDSLGAQVKVHTTSGKIGVTVADS